MKVGPKNGAYEVTVPDTWKYEEGEGSFDIYKNADVGAISISDYIIPPGYDFVIENELLDFLKSVNDPPRFKREDILYHTGSWCSAELVKDEKYFKVWLYYKDKCAIFITYVCDVVDRDIEIAEVEKIVSSIKPGSLGLFQ